MEPIQALPVASPPPAPTLPTIACSRCGTFFERLRAIDTECPSCAERRRQELLRRGLYPAWYIRTIGILLHFSFAAVLCAITWRRLENKERERTAWIAVGMGVVFLVLAVLWQGFTRYFIPANIAGVLALTTGIAERYERHREAGGKRASLLWPIAVIAGALALLVVIFGVLFTIFPELEPPD